MIPKGYFNWPNIQYVTPVNWRFSCPINTPIDNRQVNHIATRLSIMRQYTFYGDNIIRIDDIKMYNMPGGTLCPKTSRSEGSVGWIFTPTGVSTGRSFTPTGVIVEWNFTPNGVSNFYKNEPKESGSIWKFHRFHPKRVAPNEKMIPNKSVFDTWIPSRECTWGEKRGSKGRNILTDSDRRSDPPVLNVTVNCYPH